MEIRHHKGVNYTPAFPVALRGQIELLERGLGSLIQLVTWDSDAIATKALGRIEQAVTFIFKL